MNKILSTSKRYIFTFMVMAIAASVSSCGSNPTSNNPDSTTANVTPTPSSETPAPATPTPTKSQVPFTATPGEETPSSQETPTQNKTSSTTSAAGKTTDVTVYTSDTQCQELVPQKVELPAQEPVAAAVGKILKQQDNGDFNFSGYRVNVNNGVATVDLRLSPQSQRQITSLSSCEQFALFGSLRKTLTSNPQWGIKDVRFTEKGEEIVL